MTQSKRFELSKPSLVCVIIDLNGLGTVWHMEQIKELQKLIKLTGDRARLDAKANNTYIVYKTADGQIVREFPDGRIVPVSSEGGNTLSKNMLR